MKILIASKHTTHILAVGFAAFILFVACFCLTGCKSNVDTEFVGKWTVSSVKASGMTVGEDQIQNMFGATGGDLMTLDLQADGSATVTSKLIGNEQNCAWVATDAGIDLKGKDDNTQAGSANGGTSTALSFLYNRDAQTLSYEENETAVILKKVAEQQ